MFRVVLTVRAMELIPRLLGLIAMDIHSLSAGHAKWIHGHGLPKLDKAQRCIRCTHLRAFKRSTF